MDSTVIEVLLAVHALSGCDTTSQIGTKKSAFQTTEKSGEEYLKSFGKSVLMEAMVSSAEKFLVNCLSNDKKYKHLMSYASKPIIRKRSSWILKNFLVHQAASIVILSVHFCSVTDGFMPHLWKL